MKLNYLFPHTYKNFGWLVLIPATIFGLVTFMLDFEPEVLDMNVLSFLADGINGETKILAISNNNILNELLAVVIIISSLLVAFSKEKSEDEYISKIRLESLVWAVYFNSATLLLSFLFIYDMLFYSVMVFNMFTTLLFFIIRFNWKITKLNKSLNNEE